MESVSSLIERIDAEFSAAEQRWDQLRVKQLEVYQVRQQRLECFERIVRNPAQLWEPRLDALAKRFGNNIGCSCPTGTRATSRDASSFGRTSPVSDCDSRVSPDAEVRKTRRHLRC